MKCKDCDCCELGWFHSKPDAYVCIGVKNPFVIQNINAECTEYEDKRAKDSLPKRCYGLVDENGKLVRFERSPRLFIVKSYAEDAARKHNEWYKDKVKVVAFRLERE